MIVDAVDECLVSEDYTVEMKTRFDDLGWKMEMLKDEKDKDGKKIQKAIDGMRFFDIYKIKLNDRGLCRKYVECDGELKVFENDVETEMIPGYEIESFINEEYKKLLKKRSKVLKILNELGM